MQTRLYQVVGFLLSGFLYTPAAFGDSLSNAELEVVDSRLVRTVDYKGTLKIPEGDTIFIKKSTLVKASRVSKKREDYEAIVTGIVAPKGVVVHVRIDNVQFDFAKGKRKITFIYAIHVDPGSRSGGRTRLTLNLVERTGLANVVVTQKIVHWVKITSPTTTPKDIAADFHGYRYYTKRTKKRLLALKKGGMSTLSIKDQSKLPSLAKASPKVVRYINEFIRTRRRMWIAHRHLIVSLKSPDAMVAEHAGIYVKNLDKKKGEGLPAVALVDAPSRPPPEKKPPEETTATVETLQPTRVESAESGSSGDSGSISPVRSYEPNSESEPVGDLPTSSRPRQKKKTKKEEKKPTKVAKAGQKGQQEEDAVSLSTDPFAERRMRKVVLIPGYARGLVLDDPNVAHSGSIRWAWANVEGRKPAKTFTMFFAGQIAITPDIGAELTIPVEYVNVDIERARSVFTMGNPQIAAKYRMHLPKVEGRRPSLTFRFRWAVPIAPIHVIPPTTVLEAEEFTRETNFVDPFAFFLEKSALGLGAAATWQISIVQIGVQFYTDYFFPVERSKSDSQFFALSYGASVGALPFGEIVGFYLEAKASSLLQGPRRTEFFTYVGARGHFLDMIEPAVWIALPVGSVNRVNGFQLGLELRFSYDVDAILDTGKLVRADQQLIQ